MNSQNGRNIGTLHDLKCTSKRKSQTANQCKYNTVRVPPHTVSAHINHWNESPRAGMIMYDTRIARASIRQRVLHYCTVELKST